MRKLFLLGLLAALVGFASVSESSAGGRRHRNGGCQSACCQPLGTCGADYPGAPGMPFQRFPQRPPFLDACVAGGGCNIDCGDLGCYAVLLGDGSCAKGCVDGFFEKMATKSKDDKITKLDCKRCPIAYLDLALGFQKWCGVTLTKEQLNTRVTKTLHNMTVHEIGKELGVIK